MTEFKSIKELEKEIECSKDLHNENCYDICSCENLEYIKNQTQAIIKLIEAQALLPFEKVFAERLIKILKGET